MKKLLSSNIQTRVAGKAIDWLGRTKIFMLALSTFLILVVVGEMIRFALFSW